MRYDVWVDYFTAIRNSLLASSAIDINLPQTFKKAVSTINSVISHLGSSELCKTLASFTQNLSEIH